ncbi:MAG: hypothetical protein WB777_23760 [Mycobacterium sp.]
MNPRDAKRVLRWYPAGWRRRYGEELLAMLDDIHGEDKLGLHVRTSLAGSGLIQRIRLLHTRTRTYTSYSIGCAVVWAVILATVFTHAGDTTRHTFAVFFGGWVIGWLSASIARVVYPPPKTTRT